MENVKKKSNLKKWIIGIVLFFIILISGTYITHQLTPWPSAMIVRYFFDKNAIEVNSGLEDKVPDGIIEVLDLHYDESDDDALLDIYYPAPNDSTKLNLTTIVWVHGGGWISGNKSYISNYAKILADKGFTVVAVGYSIAPESTYPTPLLQLNKALDFLNRNALEYRINTNQFVLAGDSAGAQIAAQMANIITNPEYEKLAGIEASLNESRLLGTILYCGAYNTGLVNKESRFAGIVDIFLWSYSGVKDYENNEAFKVASVSQYLTKDFPPSFISAGNKDPLLPQSVALADKLIALGVDVDTLFFPKNYKPALSHEYQFYLNTEAGKTALEQTVRFLQSLSNL